METKEKPEECGSCNSPVEDLTLYPGGGGPYKPRWLCKYCARSYIGNITKYHHGGYGIRELAIALAQCFHVLEDQLREA